MFKDIMIDDVAHKFGACYLHAGCQPNWKILKQYDLDNIPLQKLIIITITLMDSKNNKQVKFADWVFPSVIITNNIDCTIV